MSWSSTTWGAERRAGRAGLLVAVLAVICSSVGLLAPETRVAAAGPLRVQTSATEPGLSWTLPETVAPGEPIELTGTGWRHGDGTGSVVAVLLDAAFSGDPDTVLTTRDVLNPFTGAVSSDKRLHTIVQAAADGSWTATVPFPGPTNSTAGVSTPAWVTGSAHQVRLLTGTLRPGDPVRSLSASLRVEPDPVATTTTITPTTAPTTTVPATTVPATTVPSTTVPATTVPATTVPSTTVPTTTGPPTWPHETVRAGDAAVAWIKRDVAAGNGATIRIRGAGWTNQAGDHASTVALKLNRGEGQQYTRTGSGIVVHPSASGDDTIWVLLSGEPSTHRNVLPIAPDGSFDVVVDAPTVAAGQHLSVLFQSGRFLDGDVQRAVTSAPLVVGGIPWVDDDEGGTVTECRSSAAAPSVAVHDAPAPLGGTIRVTGEGWCHPVDGGSVIAVKLDEGAVSRPDATLHQNRTIWAILHADDSTGSLDATIELPDGTTTSSEPGFAQGGHTLRLLTGSLKAGDTVRSVQSAEFTVGAYRPTGTPPPPEVDEDLTDARRHGVTARVDAGRLVVTVPGSDAGDWVFLTAFDGASPRYPWGARWFQLGASGTVEVPIAVSALPSGTNKLSVQSDRRDGAGRRVLLGWTTISVAAPVVPGERTPVDPSAPSARSEDTSWDETLVEAAAQGAAPTARRRASVRRASPSTVATPERIVAPAPAAQGLTSSDESAVGPPDHAAPDGVDRPSTDADGSDERAVAASPAAATEGLDANWLLGAAALVVLVAGGLTALRVRRRPGGAT